MEGVDPKGEVSSCYLEIMAKVQPKLDESVGIPNINLMQQTFF
jgi:hypothetical protein